MKRRSLGSIIVKSVMPILAWIFLAMTIGLKRFAEHSMGIQRDLVVRNKLLTAGILKENLLSFYQGSLLIGIGICVILFFMVRKKNVKNKLWTKYLIKTIGVSSLGLLIIFYYEKSSSLAYPWMTLGILIAALIQYIRIFYSGYEFLANK
jgi:branched-subunit amino acid transport protein AzlD